MELNTCFALAVSKRMVKHNPVKEVKSQKKNNCLVCSLTDEGESRMFAVLPEYYKRLVIVALHTILRKTEQLRQMLKISLGTV